MCDPAAPLGIREDTRQKALNDYAGKLGKLPPWSLESSNLMLRRVVLELEASGWNSEITSYFETYSLGPASEDVLRYAYGRGGKPTESDIADFKSYIGSGHWYVDTVHLRFAEREGHARAAAAARKRMSARVDRVITVDRAQQWMSLILGALGVLVLGWWTLRSGPLAEARWTSHWGFRFRDRGQRSGYGRVPLVPVLLFCFPSPRALGWARGPRVDLVAAVEGRSGFLVILGFAGRPWRLIVAVTLCGVLVEQLVVALRVVGTEELVFRGAFYGTLRTRFSLLPALILNSILFTVWHGYNLEGSLWIFCTGLIFA